MTLKWKREENKLKVNGDIFTVTNFVRNEIDPNNVRRLHEPDEVVRAIVSGEYGPPYMPRKFPRGIWGVEEIEETDDPVFAPIKIKTNAHQKVIVWALDDRGGYDHPTIVMVDDAAYHLHWSRDSRTTLGCGRVGYDETQIRRLAEIIRAAWARNEEVKLEVI